MVLPSNNYSDITLTTFDVPYQMGSFIGYMCNDWSEEEIHTFFWIALFSVFSKDVKFESSVESHS